MDKVERGEESSQDSLASLFIGNAFPVILDVAFGQIAMLILYHTVQNLQRFRGKLPHYHVRNQDGFFYCCVEGTPYTQGLVYGALTLRSSQLCTRSHRSHWSGRLRICSKVRGYTRFRNLANVMRSKSTQGSGTLLIYIMSRGSTSCFILPIRSCPFVHNMF